MKVKDVDAADAVGALYAQVQDDEYFTNLGVDDVATETKNARKVLVDTANQIGTWGPRTD